MQQSEIVCSECGKICKSNGGYTRHRNAKHSNQNKTSSSTTTEQSRQNSTLTTSSFNDIVLNALQRVKENEVFAEDLRDEFNYYEYKQHEEKE